MLTLNSLSPHPWRTPYINLISTLPLELHLAIGTHLTTITDFKALRKTCRILRQNYKFSLHNTYIAAIAANYASQFEADYRAIDPVRPWQPKNAAESAKWCPKLMTARGMQWLRPFVEGWKSRKRSRYWCFVEEPEWDVEAGDWEKYDQVHPGDCKCRWHKHENEERRDRLATNWLWRECVLSVIRLFDSGKWETETQQMEDAWRRQKDLYKHLEKAQVSVESKSKSKKLKGKEKGKEKEKKKKAKAAADVWPTWTPPIRTGYTGPLSRDERLKMLRFLMTEFVPNLGDGVYESEDEDDYDSDWSCEMCPNYKPRFERSRDSYGRFRKYNRWHKLSGPLLVKDEVWYNGIMEAVALVQDTECMKVLVNVGGLNWRLWRMVSRYGGSHVHGEWKPVKLSLLEIAKTNGNIEFVEYLEQSAGSK
ncbi:hypothetical protein BJ508DRAFT_414954 [Ascobolus immersus RN42]|uniref:F-box domain-containing protein n=1 Tax=Ascobolus immersus RN42 TaxID=1160509 RepID=A0A3N4I4X3_ASCIM|nr:hypothetical protein BJ508DRAFT_414954 [Ascobolus immersus RN42]